MNREPPIFIGACPGAEQFAEKLVRYSGMEDRWSFRTSVLERSRMCTTEPVPGKDVHNSSFSIPVITTIISLARCVGRSGCLLVVTSDLGVRRRSSRRKSWSLPRSSLRSPVSRDHPQALTTELTYPRSFRHAVGPAADGPLSHLHDGAGQGLHRPRSATSFRTVSRGSKLTYVHVSGPRQGRSKPLHRFSTVRNSVM